MGRKAKGPTTTFPDNWKEQVIQLGKEGKSNLEIFNLLNIGHSTHFKLLRRNIEYLQVYEKYLLEHETFWLGKAKETIETNQDFDNRLFFLIMGNKHRTRWKKNESKKK